jgi:hypothetical protein
MLQATCCTQHTWLCTGHFSLHSCTLQPRVPAQTPTAIPPAGKKEALRTALYQETDNDVPLSIGGSSSSTEWSTRTISLYKTRHDILTLIEAKLTTQSVAVLVKNTNAIVLELTGHTCILVPVQVHRAQGWFLQSDDVKDKA